MATVATIGVGGITVTVTTMEPPTTRALLTIKHLPDLDPWFLEERPGAFLGGNPGGAPPPISGSPTIPSNSPRNLDPYGGGRNVRKQDPQDHK